MLAYLGGTQVNRILPQASVLANLEAAENLFFIDASFIANQQVENPFLPQVGFATVSRWARRILRLPTRSVGTR